MAFPASTSTVQEVEEQLATYMRTHGVESLMTEVTDAVLFERPSNPIQFVVRYLQRRFPDQVDPLPPLEAAALDLPLRPRPDLPDSEDDLPGTGPPDDERYPPPSDSFAFRAARRRQRRRSARSAAPLPRGHELTARVLEDVTADAATLRDAMARLVEDEDERWRGLDLARRGRPVGADSVPVADGALMLKRAELLDGIDPRDWIALVRHACLAVEWDAGAEILTVSRPSEDRGSPSSRTTMTPAHLPTPPTAAVVVVRGELTWTMASSKGGASGTRGEGTSGATASTSTAAAAASLARGAATGASAAASGKSRSTATSAPAPLSSSLQSSVVTMPSLVTLDSASAPPSVLDAESSVLSAASGTDAREGIHSAVRGPTRRLMPGSVVGRGALFAVEEPDAGVLSARKPSLTLLVDRSLWAGTLAVRHAARMRRRVEALRRVDVFGCLDAAELGALAALSAERSFAPGSVVGRQGFPNASAWVPVRGRCVLVQQATPTDPPLELAILDGSAGRGDRFGLLGLLLPRPWHGSIVALGSARDRTSASASDRLSGRANDDARGGAGVDADGVLAEGARLRVSPRPDPVASVALRLGRAGRAGGEVADARGDGGAGGAGGVESPAWLEDVLGDLDALAEGEGPDGDATVVLEIEKQRFEERFGPLAVLLRERDPAVFARVLSGVV